VGPGHVCVRCTLCSQWQPGRRRTAGAGGLTSPAGGEGQQGSAGRTAPPEASWPGQVGGGGVGWGRGRGPAGTGGSRGRGEGPERFTTSSHPADHVTAVQSTACSRIGHSGAAAAWPHQLRVGRSETWNVAPESTVQERFAFSARRSETFRLSRQILLRLWRESGQVSRKYHVCAQRACAHRAAPTRASSRGLE
jgi:hypothetical protein